MKKLLILLTITHSLLAYDYRILVLPCGGATSIINALELAYIEKQTGQPIAHLFDEMWVASAGSIIGGLLAAPSSRCRTATAIVHLFDVIFSNYYTAYYIRQTASTFIGKAPIKNSVHPLRILTAASTAPDKEPFTPYDFSTDGSGSCSDTHIPIATIVAASCTVYPYLFLSPITIKTNHQLHCIDVGSLGCQPSIIDPTAYFLAQFLPRLHADDTATIYFLGNMLTKTIDYDDISAVLIEQRAESWAIRLHDGSFDSQHRARIEIVNIPVISSCSTIITRHLQTAPFLQRTHFKIVQTLFERIVGKRNTAPNLLAAGVIPLALLKEEAHTIMHTSKNFKAMLTALCYTPNG